MVEPDDLAAVERALGSDWLTGGPEVEAFERDLAAYCGVSFAVAVSNGTAALHAMMAGSGIGPGDEVVVPAITFVSTANAVLFEDATPVICDVDEETLLIDTDAAEAASGPRTRAIVAVDYAGQPYDSAPLHALAAGRELRVLADSCQSLGATERGRRTGSIADATVFSFHAIKNVTTGEGGAVVTNDAAIATEVRRFRNHGLTLDHHERASQGTWQYEMTSLGYNYRITDFQCALGRSQLRKVDGWLRRKRELAALYDAAFASVRDVRPLKAREDVEHAHHLYVVRIPGKRRDIVYERLREQGIGTNVHFRPVHLHAYYRERFGTRAGMCPRAEAAFEEILSLPMFTAMTEADVARVVAAVEQAL